MCLWVLLCSVLCGLLSVACSMPSRPVPAPKNLFLVFPNLLLPLLPPAASVPSSIWSPPVTRKNFSLYSLPLPRFVSAPALTVVLPRARKIGKRGGVPATPALPASPHGRGRRAFFRNAGG